MYDPLEIYDFLNCSSVIACPGFAFSSARSVNMTDPIVVSGRLTSSTLFEISPDDSDLSVRAARSAHAQVELSDPRIFLSATV